MTGRCIIGVDLGGTNVRAASYREDGSEAGPKFTLPSRAQEGTEAIFDALAEVIQQAAQAAEGPVIGVGLAIPGFVDDAAGTVRWSPNFGHTVNGVFQHWRHVPIREPLSRRLSMPIFMGNDANLAALGEYRFGTGKNSAHCLVMLTIGTGIGGGVVMSPYSVDGEARGPLLLLGGNKGGAELGHIVIHSNGLDCNAGSYGALEAYCQRDGIVQRAIYRIRRNRPSILVDRVSGDLSQLNPRLISEAAAEGDEVAREVYEEVGTMLGIGIGNYISIFAPDVFAIGGQIAKAGEVLLRPAIRMAQNVAPPLLFEDCQIVQAEHIDDAGTIGAAAFALERLHA